LGDAFLGSTGSYYIHSGLIPNTTYHYELSACKDNIDKIQSCSDFAVVSTTSWVVTPNVPTGLSLTVDSVSQITVSWNSATGGTNFYEIYRNTSDNNAGLTAIGEHLANSGDIYIDRGLISNTTYYYWVKACGTGNNCSAFSETASTKTHIMIVKLNDTGITWSGAYETGSSTGTNCLSDDTTGLAPGTKQDCHYGRDAQAVTTPSTFPKIGGGDAGFDFTKLGSNGLALSTQTKNWSNSGTEAAGTKWSCVKDNHTGLIWEVKTDDGRLHDKDDKYNWYNTDSASNGGKVGYANSDENCDGYQDSDSKTYCNTEAFVARVNKATLCGASDWRMPTSQELLSITHLGCVNPSIDSNYFPNTSPLNYWSFSPNASDSNNESAWVVNFEGGDEKSILRDGEAHIRLVRSSQ
jgi:hypothetical protein